MKQKFTLIAIVLFQTFLVAQTVKIGETTYDDLSAAVTAAVSGNTITITGTITQTAEITISDGKNLTFTGQSSALIEGDNSNRLFNITGASTLTFTDITFNSISSSSQGSVLLTNNNGADITFTNCIFSSNTTTNGNGGGALFISASDVTITNCTFSSNTSTTLGGAIGLKSSAGVTITGTTFYQNSASNRGGAISLIETAQLDLTNCTFFENSLTVKNDAFEGAAIRANAGGAKFTATNCLFYDNKDNDGDFADLGSVVGTGSSIVNSLAQYINTNVTNTNSTVTNSDYLSTSNIAWNASTNRVEFTAPSSKDDVTPIDFGNDASDVGAWNSNINLFKSGSTWNSAANWSGTVPTSTDNATFLSDSPATTIASSTQAVCNNLSVNASSSLTINGGSLIVSGTSTGNVTYNRELTFASGNANGWHLISSPVSGQTYNNAYATTNSLATSGTKRGLAFYNDALASGSKYTYLLSDDSNIASFNSGAYSGSGVGYSAKRTATGIVSFTGTINTANVNGVVVSASADGFNLLGVPYTSYMSSQTFLTANTNLDQSQIWVWKQGVTGGNFIAMTAKADNFILAPGQGFFVKKANTGATVNFAESNQVGTGGTFQRSSRTELKLLMTDGQSNRFAKLYYMDETTKGYDAGWEGEVFGGIPNSLDVFTHLVEDNQGKKYQVQSLPTSELSSMIIPVGIIADAGKELTFSTEMANFPSDVKVYLEDRANNTFNEISATKTFKVTLNEALNNVGRFYVHASKSSLSTEDDLNLASSVSIFKSDASTLTLVGLPNGTSTVKLFSILGKQVLNTSFSANGTKEISLPNLAKGVYVVQLATTSGNLNKKIVLE